MKAKPNDDLEAESDMIRGRIITLTIWLERQMDEFISGYFCNDKYHNADKRIELLELIICERMDFYKKTKAFTDILEKDCQNKGIDFNKTYPSIKKELGEIAKDRNDFAHKFLMSRTAKANDENIKMVFLNIEKALEPIAYTQERIDDIINKLIKYSDLIKGLTKGIEKPSS